MQPMRRVPQNGSSAACMKDSRCCNLRKGSRRPFHSGEAVGVGLGHWPSLRLAGSLATRMANDKAPGVRLKRLVARRTDFVVPLVVTRGGDGPIYWVFGGVGPGSSSQALIRRGSSSASSGCARLCCSPIMWKAVCPAETSGVSTSTRVASRGVVAGRRQRVDEDPPLFRAVMARRYGRATAAYTAGRRRFALGRAQVIVEDRPLSDCPLDAAE